MLQVSGAGGEKLNAVGGQAGAIQGNAAPVRVTFTTTPDGATVYVDNGLLRKGRNALRTPFEFTLSSGRHNVEFRKMGFNTATISDAVLAAGATINSALEKDPDFAQREIPVYARTGWSPAGVSIKQGHRVYISAGGKWSCGKKKELVNANGYPNDKKYHHYYVNPRLSPRELKNANYGKLIFKIGRDGQAQSAGTRGSATANASGRLYLGVNESASALGDNSGHLTVKVTVVPQ